MREDAPDRDPVREVYQKGTWHRPLAAALARLTSGSVVFGESIVAFAQMRRGDFVVRR
jgi:hypothetical protein